MSPHPQLPLPITIGDASTFDNFFVGQNHELVLALRSAVSSGDSDLIYVYAPDGAGKSHLLFATTHLARAQNRPCTYVSLSHPNLHQAEQAAAILTSLKPGQTLCVDNLSSWAGKAKKERILFTLIEQVRHTKGRLILAGKAAPEKAGFDLPDLVSRLSSGLIYPLQALTDKQLAGAIKLRARHRGLHIADEVVTYLLRRSSREPSAVFALLDTIDQRALIEKRRITIPFLQQVLTKS